MADWQWIYLWQTWQSGLSHEHKPCNELNLRLQIHSANLAESLAEWHRNQIEKVHPGNASAFAVCVCIGVNESCKALNVNELMIADSFTPLNGRCAKRFGSALLAASNANSKHHKEIRNFRARQRFGTLVTWRGGTATDIRDTEKPLFGVTNCCYNC